MNLTVSFLMCKTDDGKEPSIMFLKNKNGNYELPSFQMKDDEYDVDEFVNTTFKSITGVQAIDKKGFGWINLFLSGTIVSNKKYSFVYMCKLPDIINTEAYEAIKMSSILESENFEENYISQVIYCFNNLYIR
jgi:hypothetical protein